MTHEFQIAAKRRKSRKSGYVTYLKHTHHYFFTRLLQPSYLPAATL